MSYIFTVVRPDEAFGIQVETRSYVINKRNFFTSKVVSPDRTVFLVSHWMWEIMSTSRVLILVFVSLRILITLRNISR